MLIRILWGGCSCLWSVVSVTHRIHSCVVQSMGFEKSDWHVFPIMVLFIIVSLSWKPALGLFIPQLPLPLTVILLPAVYSFAFLRMFYSWNHSSCHLQTVFVYKAIGLQASTLSSRNVMTQHGTISVPQSIHLPSVGNLVSFQIWGIMKRVPTNTVYRASRWVWV